MDIKANDNFQFVVNCYNKSGLRRSCKTYRNYISVYVLYPLALILYGMVIYNFRFKNNNIFEVAEVFGSISAFSQLTVRKTILLMHESLLEEIIQDRSRFWNYNLFGKDMGDKFRNKMAFCVSIIKAVWIGCCFSLLFHFFTPFFVEDYILPDACWIPGDSIFFVIPLYALETICYIEAVYLVGVFDAFFLCMCTDLRIQFRLLNEMIRSIIIGMESTGSHEANCLRNLKECCNHHSFLLRVHKKLNRVFSEYFVCQYFLTIGGVCIQLFIIHDESSNTTQILRSLVFILVVNALITLLFIPASQIETETDKLALEIYDIDWYNTTNLKIRKLILFWLAKAQAPVLMSGAGLLPVNRTVLIQMQRIAFSISTLLSGK